jgi:hypothetical protein
LLVLIIGTLSQKRQSCHEKHLSGRGMKEKGENASGRQLLKDHLTSDQNLGNDPGPFAP